MSTSYLQSVPKLKGRDNYDEWSFAAQNMLVLEGMAQYIKPNAGALETDKKPQDDEKTKAKLILTIDPGLYVHIKSATTSLELWLKLKSMFDDSGFSRRITLLRHLISIRKENCDSMTTYVTQVVETAHRLNGTGFTISDEWVGSLLLAGLPERFSPMIMAIEHSGIQITADVIKSKLLDMEITTENTTDSSAAFAAKKYTQHKSGNAKNRTHRMTEEKIITCYRCKQVGHYRNQCPLLQKNKQTNAFSAVFLSGKYNKHEFYVDSGASAHMTANIDWIVNANYSQCIPDIIVANESKLPVLCVGSVNISTDCKYDITIQNVLCVPSLTTNLLSVSELIKNGNNVIFKKDQCYIYNQKNELVATAELTDGVYKLNIQIQNGLMAASAKVSGELWHRRLGHINSSDMSKMKNGAVDGLSFPENFDTSKTKCVTCCEGKQMRLSFPHVGQRSTELLQIIHADICGKMETKSIGGAQYFILFIDDYSRMTFIYFLKYKHEAFNTFKNFKSMVENQQNKKIKVFRTDNAGDLCSHEFESYLKNEGIIHQKTNSYTPEQNGVCERANRTIVEKARCMIFDAQLQKKFWAEAANTAVYLKNRSPTTALNNITPYEAWHGKKPDLSNVRVFGSPVMVHIPKQKRLKWDKKSEEHILVGYSENVKGYRIYNPRKDTISTSRDVVVMEQRAGRWNTDMHNAIWIQNEDRISVGATPECTEGTRISVEATPGYTEGTRISVEATPECTEGYRDSVGETTVNESLLSDSGTSVYTDPESSDDSDDTVVPSSNDTTDVTIIEVPEKDKRKQKVPQRYGISNLCVSSTPEVEPITFSEALQGPEAPQWKMAMEEELHSFECNEAWEVVNVPSGASIVQCKWVLNKKIDLNNEVRYRARLVAKGFTQKRGIDYTDTFSPVVKHSTLRMLFALSVQIGMDITHLDVNTAFLNGYLKEDIYMTIPDGFIGECRGKVLKLKRAIYGLKQSSLVWYEKVKNLLCNIGFKNSKYEPCLFTKFNNDVKLIITLYVDDFLIFSNNAQETDRLKATLNSEFKIKDLGSVRKYLGMRINVDRECNSITVDQQQYIEQLLSKFDMSESRPADTPIECKLNLEKSENCNSELPYQKLIGSLMYLAVLTRPDIAYSISYLSQFNNCYNEVHYNYAKRILKYLHKTKHYCLKYNKGNNEQLEGFVDSDWASCELDRKSFSGYCFIMSGSVISWQSRKQQTISLSSTEAEYVSLSEGSREAIYLRNLLYELTGKLCVIKLYCDNQSALKLATSPQSNNRTKHIDVRFHYVRDAIKKNLINVSYTQTQEMPADLLTKGLPSVKHYKFMKMLGIVK